MYSLLICGSRIATPQMLELARRVVQRASELGWTILVGDAAGIDAEVICACESLKLPAKCFGISPQPRATIIDTQLVQYIQVQVPHSRRAYLQRDEIMVRQADRLYAIWNGTSGGTIYTYKYALSQRKPAHLWDATGRR